MASAVKRLIMGNNNNYNGNSALLVCLMYGNGSFFFMKNLPPNIVQKTANFVTLLFCYTTS